MNPRRLFFIAGEESGDTHGAALITALRAQDPSLACVGYGGAQMARAGMALRENLVTLAGIGLDFFTALPRLWIIFRRICQEWDRDPPAAVVLIDYPGLNLRVARAATSRGIPVIYFISPQVWAWGEHRVKTIRDAVDRMLVVFQFEEVFYRERGVNVTCVGHPLLDRVHIATPREQFLTQLGFSPTAPTVAVLPGSRRGEIARHLPTLLETLRRVQQQIPALQCLLPHAATTPRAQLAPAEQHRSPRLVIVRDQLYDALAASDAALVASGTATLETALVGCPMLILYKTSPWTYAMGRRVVKLPYIGLVNVVSGRAVVPEFLQGHATPAQLAPTLQQLLTQPALRDAQRHAFTQLRQQLGQPGACTRAAHEILAFLTQQT